MGRSGRKGLTWKNETRLTRTHRRLCCWGSFRPGSWQLLRWGTWSRWKQRRMVWFGCLDRWGWCRRGCSAKHRRRSRSCPDRSRWQDHRVHSPVRPWYCLAPYSAAWRRTVKWPLRLYCFVGAEEWELRKEEESASIFVSSNVRSGFWEDSEDGTATVGCWSDGHGTVEADPVIRKRKNQNRDMKYKISP